MTDSVPTPTHPDSQSAAGETLLEITSTGDNSGPGETLLALDAGTGNQSVLARIEAATGTNLSTRPVELQSSDLTQQAASQAATRPSGSHADFATRATGAVRASARYAAAQELGRGGMGLVLKVRDNDLRREVAMKVVRSDRARPGTQSGDAALRSFVEEAQITGQLEHPNIVPVHELGADPEGRIYFTMKLVRGRPLSDIIKSLRSNDPATLVDFPLDRLLQIFMKVCDALSFAHAHNVIHRDLKPDNIMIGRFGEVLVMDWGLARVLNQSQATGAPAAIDAIETDSRERKRQSGDAQPGALSMEGVIAGTPAYMAPEQARGQVSRIDQTSDVFALGAILYELLVLRPPYQGEGGTRIIEKAADGDIVPPAERAQKDPELRALLGRLPGGTVPAELQAIAMHALRFRQESRYATVRLLKEDIENYQAGRPVSVRQDPLAVRAAKWVRRHPTFSMSTAAAAAVVLISVATIMFLVAQARKETMDLDQQRLAASQRAEEEARGRAEAEGETAKRERQLKDAALAREEASRRRAVASESFRLGSEQADRAREITDFPLRITARNEALGTLTTASREDPDYVDPWFALGQLHHFFRDSQALTCYSRVDEMTRATTGKGDARALVYAGDFARLVLNDPKTALEYYRQAAEISPNEPLALVGQGYVELIQGDFAKAVEFAEKAHGLDGSLWEPFLLQGFASGSQFKRGDRELNPLYDPHRAEELLSQGLVRNSRQGVLFNERGAARIQLARFEDAQSDLRRAIELMPAADEPIVNLAISQMHLGQLQQAHDTLRPLIDRNTRLPAAWMEWGTVLTLLKSFETGDAALQNSLALAPGRPAPLTNLGYSALWQGKPAQAEQYALQALAVERDYVTAYVLLCEARQNLHKLDEALSAANQALMRQPEWGVAWAARSRVVAELGRPQEALQDAQNAIKDMPGSDSAWGAQGSARFLLGQYEQAVQDLRKALEINPSNGQARFNLAVALKKSGRATEALNYARDATRYPQYAPLAWREVGDGCVAMGEYRQALDAYLKATDLDPANGQAWINAALCANKLDRPVDARQYALKATQATPDHVLAWVQLCQSEIRLGNTDAANEAVNKAATCKTDDPVFRADVAAMYHDLGRMDDAIALCREIAAAAPEYARPWDTLASALTRQGKRPEAINARTEQARRDPRNPDPLARTSWLLYELKKYPDAIAAGKQALALDANCAMAHKYIALSWLEQKQYDLAAESFEAEARARVTDAWAWVNVGVTRIQQKRTPDAIAPLIRATEVDPENDTAWWYLGLCYKATGKWKQAYEAFDSAAQVKPEKLDAWLEAAGAATSANMHDEAVAAAEHASQMAPKDMRCWYRLGSAWYGKGDFQKAADAFATGRDLAPDNQWFRYLLAQCLVETGQWAQAKTEASKCIELDETVNDAYLLLARCALEGDNTPQEAVNWLRKGLEKGVRPADLYAQQWLKPLLERADFKKLQQDYPAS